MDRIKKGSKGFTLMELMVVVAILAVLMAIVAPAVTGTKSASVEGQVTSDASAVQKATDTSNNKSIKTRKTDAAALQGINTALTPVPVHYKLAVPEVALSETNLYKDDVYAVGGAGAGVILLGKDGLPKSPAQTLASTIVIPGSVTTENTGGTTIPKRTVINFAATTDVYDASGAVKTATFVPDFLSKAPASIILMGDETKALGDANTYEEFLWLYLVNAPGTDGESRTVEVYRMTAATVASGAATATALTYTQIY